MATEPKSLANSQFCSLGTFNYNKVLADDFCHKKLGTFKIKGATAKNTSFHLKTNLVLKKGDDNKSSKLGLTDEYKFGFPYERLYLQTRVKRNGDVKMHLDGGNVEVAGKKFNLFGGLKTTVIFANYDARVGFNYFGEKCESNVRFQKDNKGNHDLADRVVLTHGSWRYGGVGIFGVDSLVLKKYDSFVEFRQPDYELHLSHMSPAVHPDGIRLGKVSIGALYKVSPSINLALQVKKNCSFPKLRAVLGVQNTRPNGLTLRAKCDSKLKISYLAKYKANSKVTVSLGAQFNFEKGSKFIDLNKTLPLPIGFGVDIEA